jgi:sugar phosphate isomerase/epimerase
MRIAVSEHLVPGTFRERLAAARELGADGLELLFGPHGHEQHLLWRADGPAGLRSLAEAAGVPLASVFAGYFHERPLSHPDAATRRLHALALERLRDACAEAGVGVLVLPLAGAADLRCEGAPARLVEALAPLAAKAAARQVTVALELAQPLVHLAALRASLPDVRVAYDVGQATSLGADVVVDLKLLGDALGQVRVRDVTSDGRRVALGRGAADFPAAARQLAAQPFPGWCVLESSPGADPRESLRADLSFLRSLAA